MCGIGGILRIHKPGSPEAERLAAHHEGFRTPAYELFHQPCRNGAPTADPVDAGPRPYGTGTAALGGGAWTIDEHWLDILEDSVKHRGPDGRGRFRDAAVRPDGSVVEVALIHRRLSILDHEGGAQPMVSPRGRDESEGLIAVVFNGCIYNHRELRKELEARGHVFQTDHSDTEVLIHGWREWGSSLVWKLRGMYAHAVWDPMAAQVFVSRDYFGERPLYLLNTRDASFQAFSSGSTALHRLALQIGSSEGREIDHALLLPWIGKGYDNVATPWRGVAQVPQTSTIAMSRDGPPQDRAGFPEWPMSPAISAEPVIEPAGALVERVDRMIRSVVGGMLEADVPIACLLSGGVDSSVVAAAASDRVPRLVTITVKMPGPRYDESRQAAQVAERIGSEHHIVEVSPNPASDLVMLIESLGLPFGDSSLLPTYWACQAAAGRARVLLTGDGGDELFGGYERYEAAGWLRWGWWFPAFVPIDRLSGPDPRSPRSKLIRLISAGAHAGYIDLLCIFPMPDRLRLVGRAWVTAFLASAPCKSFEEARWFDLHEHLPGDMLRKVDHAAMIAGVEVRAPLLDWEFGDAIIRGLSKHLLLPDNQRKGLLRAIARKYFPPEIVDRPKMGFAIPIGEWFRSDYGGMRQLLHDHLNSAEPWGPSSLGVESMINMSYVRQMLREHDQAGERSVFPWRGRDHSQRLYMLLVLSIWAKWLGRL